MDMDNFLMDGDPFISAFSIHDDFLGRSSMHEGVFV